MGQGPWLAAGYVGICGVLEDALWSKGFKQMDEWLLPGRVGLKGLMTAPISSCLIFPPTHWFPDTEAIT